MALIVFTIIFAIAIILAGEKGKPVLHLMDCMTEVIVKPVSYTHLDVYKRQDMEGTGQCTTGALREDTG